jgi:hypothetical protein
MLKLATKFSPTPANVERAHRAGFHQAELFLNAPILAGGAQVISLARHYPMEYALHCPNERELSPESLRQMTDLYRALGCRALVIHQPQFDRYGTELMRLEPNLRPGIENHRLSLEQFDAWAERNPGLTLDVEYLWKFTLGDVPLAELLAAVRRFLTRFSSKLRHVHMPGYVPGQAEHRPMYCSRDMVFGVLSLFAEFGFDGLIVSEVNQPFQTDEDLRMDVLLFQRWRAEFERVDGEPGACVSDA